MLTDFPADWLLPTAAALGTTMLLYTVWRRRERRGPRFPEGVSLENQSVLLDEERLIYGSAVNGGKLITTADPSIRTLYDAFLKGMTTSPTGECLGTRDGPKGPYQWTSYAEVFRMARDFGSGLRNMGLEPGSNTFVGIYARNCPEWFVTALGCITQSIVIVPLYDTLGPEAATFITSQTETQVIVCENEKKVSTLVQRLGHMPSLKNIVVIDDTGIDQTTRDTAAARGVQILSFSQVANDGERRPAEMELPSASDLYVICYTSGTTGLPKGVMLTHGNLVANLSCLLLLEKYFDEQYLSPGEAVISYLPLSHMFEQMVHWMSMFKGAKIGYFTGNIMNLMDDMKSLKPSFFPVVPRLLNRLYDKVNGSLEQSGTLARTLFNVAYQAKLAELKQGIVRKDSIWDKLVFGRLQNELGGNVRVLPTGSAPIAAEVLELCRVTLGSQIFEGYGQTECTALATNTMPGDFQGGHVGGPSLCAHIRLADVPELNYFAKNGQGEICVRGPSVTQGYFKDPERTADTLDEDGWLHTGDVGQWLSNGTLKIIDRKKHIFKLAQGEYVAPEKIENVYMRSAVVAQLFVDGSSLERNLVAVVVPDEQVLRHWLAENEPDLNQSALSFSDICLLAAAKKHVSEAMQKLAKENKLNSIEQVKNIKLISQPFTVENGLLTPTLKAKRPQLRKHFAPDVAELYKS